MISVKTKAHIGPDGTLTVAVPTPLAETDAEPVVTKFNQTAPGDIALCDIVKMELYCGAYRSKVTWRC